MEKVIVSSKILDNYLSPQNCGVISNPTVLGSFGDYDLGIKIDLYLVISDRNIIEDIKFKTFGCITSIASASMLTQIVMGKDINWALGVGVDDLSMALGQIPEEKLYCCEYAIKALRDGISKICKINNEGEQVLNHAKF